MLPLLYHKIDRAETNALLHNRGLSPVYTACPLERWCTTREELVEQVAVTVIHEVAHHFGIDDARLHELGWE